MLLILGGTWFLSFCVDSIYVVYKGMPFVTGFFFAFGIFNWKTSLENIIPGHSNVSFFVFLALVEGIIALLVFYGETASAASFTLSSIFIDFIVFGCKEYFHIDSYQMAVLVTAMYLGVVVISISGSQYFGQNPFDVYKRHWVVSLFVGIVFAFGLFINLYVAYYTFWEDFSKTQGIGYAKTVSITWYIIIGIAVVIGLVYPFYETKTAAENINNQYGRMLRSQTQNMESSTQVPLPDFSNSICRNESENANSVKMSFSMADELGKYKSLLDSGAITQEEYDLLKRKIIGDEVGNTDQPEEQGKKDDEDIKAESDSSKILRTIKGDLVRSKSEIIIANALYTNGIQYEYEVSLFFDGEEFRPDFKITDKDGNVWYWEHCGLMNAIAYRGRWERKKSIYREHGIVEGKNLIVTYDDIYGGIDSAKISQIILEKFMQNEKMEEQEENIL